MAAPQSRLQLAVGHAALAVLAIAPALLPVPTNANIVVTALACIFVGSWRSVKSEPPADAMTKKVGVAGRRHTAERPRECGCRKGDCVAADGTSAKPNASSEQQHLSAWALARKGPPVDRAGRDPNRRTAPGLQPSPCHTLPLSPC